MAKDWGSYWKKQRAENIRRRKADEETLVTCVVCGVELMKKRLQRHMNRVHPKYEKPLTRGQRISRAFNPDKKNGGSPVISGGAYGLGKSRKH